jgi:hypothetical protein
MNEDPSQPLPPAEFEMDGPPRMKAVTADGLALEGVFQSYLPAMVILRDDEGDDVTVAFAELEEKDQALFVDVPAVVWRARACAAEARCALLDTMCRETINDMQEMGLAADHALESLREENESLKAELAELREQLGEGGA